MEVIMRERGLKQAAGVHQMTFTSPKWRRWMRARLHQKRRWKRFESKQFDFLELALEDEVLFCSWQWVSTAITLIFLIYRLQDHATVVKHRETRAHTSDRAALQVNSARLHRHWMYQDAVVIMSFCRTSGVQGRLQVSRCTGNKRCSHYLDKESVPLILTLDGLDCYILSFPYGLEDNSKRPSANGLKKEQHDSII